MKFVTILFMITALFSSQTNGRFILDDDYQRRSNDDSEQWLSLSSSLSKRQSSAGSLFMVFIMFDIDSDLQDQFTEIVNRLSEEERKPLFDAMGINIVMATVPVCPEVGNQKIFGSDDQESGMQIMKILFDLEVKNVTKKFSTNDRNVVNNVFEQMRTKQNAAKACEFMFF
ncbi:unnamed protein product [Didymodactylos carnosus]|uniref:Uncharacterized protein n=1 Tax=Didymodactylos carnosus TaxID=1234261 RepID=A0A815VGD2_9BILA|nr:unnamed protein product [Didymodactylos carnosus]CAF1532015.1 unnamed protein product [Didymodactylos carnosus]CAF4242307.1 unnamed protein product [Didymodactylos carnosus]CAF4391376.1 unnamed protein product [Didymodactylos carnosus]